MICMGIDQSFTSTGVVVKEGDTILYHNTINSDPNEDKIARAEFIANRLKMIFENLQPNMVVIEGLSFMSAGNVTRDLAGLQYIIISRLREATQAEHIHIVAASSLKKFATGTGRAKKSDMYDSLPDTVREEMDVYYKKSKGRSDVVDAYWLATYGITKN